MGQEPNLFLSYTTRCALQIVVTIHHQHKYNWSKYIATQLHNII